MFRDSQVWHGRPINQVDRFFRQVDANALAAGRGVSYHLVEGNSADGTLEALLLHAARRDATVLRHEVEGTGVASVASEQRFRNLSAVANVALRSARDSGADFVLWVESDFVLRDDVLRRLLAAFDGAPHDLFGVCPVPVFGGEARDGAPRPQGAAGPSFYDTWAFRGEGGEAWQNHQLAALVDGPRYRPMAAFGSAALMNARLMRQHGIDFGTGCFPDLCAQARRAGYRLFCDTRTLIEHPAEVNIAGRLV
jgi:GT2 family glycosyltransferase